MRGNSIIWGAALVLLGALLLLSNLGLITLNIWGVFWPVAMILFGVWVLWGVAFRRDAPAEHRTIPLEGAGHARVRLKHGAGRLNVSAGSEPGALASGEFGGGLDLRTRRDGELLEVEMQIAQANWGPWNWSPGRLDWTVGFTRDAALSLYFETGAGEARLDLTELRVTDLSVHTGASSTDIYLPANAGLTQVTLESGAASTRLHVPAGVAARIRFDGGLSSLTVDPARFPRSGEFYQSTDYETAANRVDMRLQAGAGAVEVR